MCYNYTGNYPLKNATLPAVPGFERVRVMKVVGDAVESFKLGDHAVFASPGKGAVNFLYNNVIVY